MSRNKLAVVLDAYIAFKHGKYQISDLRAGVNDQRHQQHVPDRHGGKELPAEEQAQEKRCGNGRETSRQRLSRAHGLDHLSPPSQEFSEKIAGRIGKIGEKNYRDAEGQPCRKGAQQDQVGEKDAQYNAGHGAGDAIKGEVHIPEKDGDAEESCQNEDCERVKPRRTELQQERNQYRYDRREGIENRMNVGHVFESGGVPDLPDAEKGEHGHEDRERQWRQRQHGNKNDHDEADRKYPGPVRSATADDEAQEKNDEKGAVDRPHKCCCTDHERMEFHENAPG